MANPYFQFKQFTIHQDQCVMKVTTDACLFGAWVAEEVKKEKLKPHHVLDIGAGTGLLALIFSQKNSGSYIDAVEIDKDSYKQAKENVHASPFSDFIHVIHRDAREILFEKKYDVIFSNPPFYEKEIISQSEKKNIAHHGAGLLVEELLSIIQKNLKPMGRFFLLLPYKREEEINKKLAQKSLYPQKILYVRQSVNHDFFRIMVSGTNKKPEKETEEIDLAIWDANQQYTEDFKNLLNDYYLHL